jgi:transposase InsO family protein
MRIWRLEGLKVPNKQPKRARLWLNDESCMRLAPQRRNHVWSWDFVFNRTRDSRVLKLMVAHDLRKWLERMGSKTAYITPGSPWENGYCESFNGEIFYTLKEAQVIIENWQYTTTPDGRTAHWAIVRRHLKW